MKDKCKKKILFLSIILGVIVLISIFAPLIAPYDPIAMDMTNRLATPNAINWLGTDNLGRDLLSRVIYGGRTSLMIACVSTTLSMAIGLVVGLISGFFGGKIDIFTTLVSNIFQGLPSMILMIVLVSVLQPGNITLIIVLTITSWVGFSRYVRSQAIALRSQSYIEGLRALGASNTRMIFKGILPNILGGCLVLYTTRIGRMVLSISGLSYLGIGIQAPTPDWGKMISEAHKYVRTDPHLFIAPSICIVLFSFTINLLGDALRDYLDIKNQSIKEI